MLRCCCTCITAAAVRVPISPPPSYETVLANADCIACVHIHLQRVATLRLTATFAGNSTESLRRIAIWLKRRLYRRVRVMARLVLATAGGVNEESHEFVRKVHDALVADAIVDQMNKTLIPRGYVCELVIDCLNENCLRLQLYALNSSS